MAIKVDGTNNKLILLAGTGNSTSITSDSAATPWTLTLPPNAGVAGQSLVTDGTGVATWSQASGTVINDTTTNLPLYPLFSSITSGFLNTEYVSSPKYTYNPFLGELTSPVVQASNGIFLNSNTITADYTFPASTNGLSAGPVSVVAGVNVIVNGGSSWRVL